LKISGLFIAALLSPLVIACSAGDAQPTQTDIPSELPTASLTPPPTLTATPAATNIPVPTVRVLLPTPTVPVVIPIPASEASIFAYQPSGGILAASSDGEWSIPVIHRAMGYASHSSSPFIHALAPADGSIAYVTGPTRDRGYTLWIYRPNSLPQALVTVDGPPTHIESVAISQDGSQVAYSLLYWPASFDDWNEQLWVVEADGGNNRLVADRTGDAIVDPGPFRLGPVAWSEDMAKIYMVTNTDSESTPTGLYEADVATGEIRKASTPQETLWRAMFNEDRSKVLYSSFQWVSVNQGFPERGPPFAVKITDLASDTTRVVWESDAAFVSDAVWAPDETAVAVSMAQNKLAIADLNTGELKIVTEGDPDEWLQPRAWLSDGRIVYTSGLLYSDLRLMSIRTDGSDPIFIDDVEQVHVLGELPSSSFTPKPRCTLSRL